MTYTPWPMKTGFFIGAAIGGFTLLLSPISRTTSQQLSLIIVPAAIGILVVIIRNSWRKAGEFNPKHQEKNKRGRL